MIVFISVFRLQPTTLNCMHSFCASCIAQWMKIKKVCPACRAPIVTHIRSIVLDNYIEKMVEQLSGVMKEKRQRLVNERIGIRSLVSEFSIYCFGYCTNQSLYLGVKVACRRYSTPRTLAALLRL